MNEQDPRPLKSVGETPTELAHALRALGERDRDRARLARVADRLRTSISTAPLPSWQDKLGGGKLLLVGLAIGASMFGPSRLEERAGTAPTPPAAISIERPAPEPPSAPASTPAPTATLVALPHPRAAPPPPASQPKRRRTERTPASSPFPAAAPVTTAETPEPASPPASAATEPASLLATPAAPARTPKPLAEPAALAAPAPKLSEVALLQRARTAVSEQPTAALELLREHVDRFPSGMLAPERELLTIEALLVLGRRTEATKRQQQFEARYPGSIYSRRLQLTPANQM